ncbi:MAG TPA: YfiR family protein [Cyclobacteriaceae bacterium]
MSRILLICGLLASLRMQGAGAPPQVPDEYKVKAVFLFHFAQFVEWPEKSFSRPDEPMVIGVLGEDPFGNYLDEVVSGESIQGHPLQVKRFSKLEEIDKCHILFVSADGLAQLRAVLRELEPRPTLTVGDNPAFIRAGGMIRFFSEDSKIRLQINPEAARSCGLMISSKLLRLADISIPKT